MRLYAGPLSLFSRKVEIALSEKFLPFERTMVAFTQTEGYRPKHPVVLAANPKGQVPVLVDGDLTLYDSTVILEYVEDAYPSPPLYPHTAAARARCRLLELFADEVLLAPVRMLMFRTEPPSGDPTRRAELEAKTPAAEADIAAHLAALDRDMGEAEFLCGGFSAADIAVFVTVLYALRLRGARTGPYPALGAWFRRLAERPAFASVAAEIAAADRALSFPVPGAPEALAEAFGRR